MSHRAPPRPPAAPPATAEAGAGHVHTFMLDRFARRDGQTVDWKLMTEIMFKAAFEYLDKLPEDQRRSLARPVHAGAYERVTGGETGE